MTPAISAGDLALLRSRPHTVEWFLAVAPYGPATFTAQVNDIGAAKGDQVITYDNDVGENTVLSGMTLWIGSAAGLYDIGKARIRSIDTVANTINVAENDDIMWADDLHLTVPGEEGFFEIWGRFQRMTEAAGVVTFYEDYNDLFSSPQDTVLPPKANAGPPVCAWIDPTLGHVDVSFTGDRSFTTEVGAAIATYLWDFSDGVIQVGTVNTMGSCAVPVVVRYNTPGFRYVSLTVTDNTAQARTHVVRVPVWIFEEGVEDPYTKVEVVEQMCTPSSGWTCRLKVFQTNTTAEDVIYNFPDGALVVLFTKTSFGGTEDDVGGFCFRENIRFVGWIESETLKFDFDAGTVEFDAVSHDGVLRRLPGFPFTLELVDVPATDWYELEDLNADRALMYLLRYHTTATLVCHVEIPGEGNNRDIAVMAFTDGSIYNQAQNDLLADARCVLLADRQGILRATRDPQFMSAADRVAVEVVCTLLQTNPNNQADWMNVLDEIHPHQPIVGMVRLGGYSGTTPLLSQAPGDAPRQQQAILNLDGMILQDQAEANLWSGLALTQANNPFPRVPIELSGYWPVFDPAHQEYVQLTTTDALGRNVWTSQKFVVREMQFRSHPTANVSVTRLMVEIENEIFSGETQTIPVAPPPEPPVYPPSPPIPPPIPPPDPETEIKAAVCIAHTDIAYTDNLLEHHVNSTATAGTGGLLLFDTLRNFVTIGVAIGDVVQNLTTLARTTVAAINGAHQLTLNANIGLAPATPYHIAGVQWVDIKGPVIGAAEYFLQFEYIQTSASTVGAWAVTDVAVYFTANILTPAPVWVQKLTLVQIKAATGLANAALRGLAVYARNPLYCIVNFRTGVVGVGSTRCCVYTTDQGTVWNYSARPNSTDGNTAPYHGIAIDQNTGHIFNLRGYAFVLYCFRSTDGGVNFVRGTNVLATWGHEAWVDVGGLHRPYTAAGTSTLFGQARQSALTPSKSVDNGDNWAIMAAPAGYTRIDFGGEITGWFGDINDVLSANFTRNADAHNVILRSPDAGATWSEICDIDTIFDGHWGGAKPWTWGFDVWIPNEDVLTVVSNEASGFGGAHDQRRVAYSDDGGTIWCDKTGNWYAVFGTFPSGIARCVGLPRVGSNA